MSFLPGRLAATEGAYFLHESKHAAGRLADKLAPSPSSSSSASASASPSPADVLPEILRHSIPIKRASAGSDPSLSTASKWLLNGSGSENSVSADAINPLRAYVSLPQATFGPKRSLPFPVRCSFNSDFIYGLGQGLLQIKTDPVTHMLSFFLRISTKLGA